MIKFTQYATRPHNEYFLEICNAIIDRLEKSNMNASVYYYNDFHQIYYQFQDTQRWFDKDPAEFIVLVMSDFISNGQETVFNVDLLRQFDKKFLIVSTVENASADITIPPNVDIIHMGPDWCHGKELYPKLAPQEKVDEGPHWICLNRWPRQHRIITQTFLLGMGLGYREDPRGILRAVTPPAISNFDSWIGEMGVDQETEHVRPILNDGWIKLVQGKHYVTDMYCVGDNYYYTSNNAGNYEEYLRDFYRTTVVDVITETLYYNRSISPSEKYFQSVYGMNFPIMISCPGTVDYLRKHGFDVFDDVIDHSYDKIEHDVNRIIYAINSNFEMLANPAVARAKWHECRERFEKNIAWARGPMYDHFKNMALQNFDNYMLTYQPYKP